MSTFVDFAPSALTPFTFQPTLANGVQYIVTVPYNEFGQRYYIVVTDLVGNLILSRGLSSSGPTLDVELAWADNVATVTTSMPHLVSILTVVNARISQSNSGFDGTYPMLSTGPDTLTYALVANPNEVSAISGNINFDLDLLAGYGIGSLFFHQDTNQFEF